MGVFCMYVLISRAGWMEEFEWQNENDTENDLSPPTPLYAKSCPEPSKSWFFFVEPQVHINRLSQQIISTVLSVISEYVLIHITDTLREKPRVVDVDRMSCNSNPTTTAQIQRPSSHEGHRDRVEVCRTCTRHTIWSFLKFGEISWKLVQ